jgi:hypothetical protein
MKSNAITFAICASAFLASPALAQMTPDLGMVKTLAENEKLSLTEN